ncbi:MAG: sulfatase-like hydrolase/transferase [Akkermansiaceae bacterium]|nr:sulfatase-like hydrolase/transferase [Akkermansiaceae bacterium]
MLRVPGVRHLALAISLVLPAGGAAPATGHGGPPPNILLIMADDLGFSDLGCYGGEIATPNLDAVAAEGLRFTQFYNTARCWPTRGALMTGYYAQQIRRDKLPGIPSGGGNRGKRPGWAPLLPKLLKPAGYRSYHTGKWHIDGMPVAEGFDHSYYLKDQGRFFNPTRHWKDDKPLPPVGKDTGFYATTALADHVIEVLRDHAAHHAGKPFFHYLAFAAPHFPLHALPQDIAKYADTYTPGWEAVRARRWDRLQRMGLLKESGVHELSRVERDLGPPYSFPAALEILGPGEVNKPVPWTGLTGEQQKFQATKMAIHAAMIHRMDIEIGRVFEQIRKMGEWENTLVIFLSDNGASAEIMVRDDGHDPSRPPGSAGTYLCLGPGWSTVSNTPFRRHKTWTHEGGIATPFIVSWPKGIKARGEIRRNPGHVIDVVPTLLELTGAKAPATAPPAPGKNLLPVFARDGSVEREDLWWFHDGHKAIRVGDWKAVAPAGEPWELYNLANDRDESTDLAASRDGKLKELVAAWDRHLEAFIELAGAGSADRRGKRAQGGAGRAPGATQAEAAEKPARRQVLLGGESFLLNGQDAFLMAPAEVDGSGGDKPWIFYAPTLNRYPDKAESWMHRQFLDAGVAVAGIDVGEAYGSPRAFPHFEALYQHMVKNGYARKPALLGRSRGGLWVSSWALKHPDRVAGIGGIYPVYDYTTYPGVKRAAAAYGMSAGDLLAQQARLNPVKRAGELAAARIPVFIIHGTDDKVVPLAANSAALEDAYRKSGRGDLITVLKPEGQGHSFWEGFFTCQGLVDFLIREAKGAAAGN